MQNSIRMEERNKNYAADSARQTAEQIDEELNNALDLIKTYTFFIGESLNEPVLTRQMLRNWKKTHSLMPVLYRHQRYKLCL